MLHADAIELAHAKIGLVISRDYGNYLENITKSNSKYNSRRVKWEYIFLKSLMKTD